MKSPRLRLGLVYSKTSNLFMPHRGGMSMLIALKLIKSNIPIALPPTPEGAGSQALQERLTGAQRTLRPVVCAAELLRPRFRNGHKQVRHPIQALHHRTGRP